jgi:Fe2+ or Zn2+ uptake regulation protein
MASISRSTQAASSRRTFAELARRVRSRELTHDGPDAGYSLLIGAIGDVGRALDNPRKAELRSVLVEVAALREGLEEENDAYFGTVARSPRSALSTEKLSTAYAAGALWALSSIISNVIDAGEHQRERRRDRASRSDRRELVAELMRSSGPLRPTDVERALRELDHPTDRPTISRILKDLLNEGLIQGVAVEDAPDRRARYYGWSGATDTDAVPLSARLALREALATCASEVGADGCQGLVDEEMTFLSRTGHTATTGDPAHNVAPGPRD